MRETFVRLHNRGGYFRILGFGFLVNVTDHPLYEMRKHGHHIGSVWFRVLRPRRDFVSNKVTLTIQRNPEQIDGSW